MVEDGVAFVHLRDETVAGDSSCTCGCGNPDCGCQDPDCDGCCCEDKGCGDDHNWVLLDSIDPTCLTLGYDRYLCIECGMIEKRDYEAALGHAYQSSVIREATCETPGKTLDICQRCGDTKETTIPQESTTFPFPPSPLPAPAPAIPCGSVPSAGSATLRASPRRWPITMFPVLPPPPVRAAEKTIHLCEGCGSSFITDYTPPLGHSWDEGKEITDATCTGEGMAEYTCGPLRRDPLEGDPAAGHVPGTPATCTEPQLCEKCGAVIENALGHDYQEEVTAPTCEGMGHTTYTCSAAAIPMMGPIQIPPATPPATGS